MPYQAAINGAPQSTPQKSAVGTLKWLIERYRETHDWAKLSLATRKQREAIFRHVLDRSGDKPYRLVTKQAVQNAIDRQKATPFQARNFLKTMRGLFRWALAAQHVVTDPTDGLKAAGQKAEGFRVWTEDEVARFEARWPIGTRERLAFDLLLFTGLRRGDVARLGRQHVKDGIITLRTDKTGQVVNLPILPVLAASIAATPAGNLTFIATVTGRPMVKEGFGNWFREVCDRAGVEGSAHGLRKLGATRAADNGATEAQLEAIFGWRGGGMAALYTRQANRKRLAIEAMSKLAPAEQTQDAYSRTSLPGAGAKPGKAS